MKHTQEELQAIVDAYNAPAKLQAEIADIRKAYTQEEIDTFWIQETEAKQYSINQNAETPLIDGIISENGRTKQDQVARILEKSKIYKAAVGRAIGRRQKK